jgi:hypothetical protein
MSKKKLLVTFSGGETSAFMGNWLNKKMQNEYEMLFVFANTGVESNETLEFVHKCEKEFGLDIKWIEAKVYHNQRKSTGFKIVDYNSATRNTDWKNTTDTPFEEVVKKYGIPNHSRLHCTRELKMNPIKNYAKSIWGKEKYYLALGIRIDEIDRMNAKKDELRLVYPLIQKNMQPMTKKHINFWWNQQLFRLILKGYQGNCGACYKKSNNKLMQMVKDDINYFEFLGYLENKYGNPNGRVPEKVYYEYKDEFGETITGYEMEKVPTEEYKNVFFRNFVSVKEMIEMSKGFDKIVKDDSIDTNFQESLFDETESCEVFSNCGE